MQNPLPLRPTPKQRETVPSFLSRIAAFNSLDAAGFGDAFGFSVKATIDLQDVALNRLAVCGGLSTKQLEELISWTGRRIGNVRFNFRGETFVSRALRNPVIRGCPMCLQQDARDDPETPLKHMAMRGHWQFREVSVCTLHKHNLVPLWEQSYLKGRYDISARLREILPELMSSNFNQPTVKPSPYDLWLDERMATGSDETWLAEHSLYAATTFCRLLGTELLRMQMLPKVDTEDRHRLAQAKGFEVARQGPAAIREIFDMLAASANGPSDEPKKAFGGLYTKLSIDYLHEDAFAVIRRILRDCIVDVWPVAAGIDVLGFTQKERILHSINTAEKETGVGAFLLEQFLVHAGAIEVDDKRPNPRKTFDAVLYAELLSEIPTLIGPMEMRLVMGATRIQLECLAADGILVPRIDISTVNSPWRASDGLALNAELHEMAMPVAPSDKQWEIIQWAKSRTTMSVGIIIASIRDRRLLLGQRTDTFGYARFCVLKAEIDSLGQSMKPPIDQSHRTAAAFGRSVGNRRQGWFEKLSSASHTPATRMPHPKWGGMRTYVSEADEVAFHKRFMTLTTMATETGEDRRSLLAKLKAAGITPFAPEGEDYGALYLRQDVKGTL